MQGVTSKIVYDQMGYEVEVPRKPSIISLVPSLTELLFDLGLEHQISGVTKFCVHPIGKVKGKRIIGGTKSFNFKTIDQLQPGLIIGNKEENYKEGIERLKLKYPVWMSDVTTCSEALEMIRHIGELTNTVHKADQIAEQINEGFLQLKKQPPKRVLYFIWRAPLMVVGGGTFIDEILKKIGLKNVAAEMPRYPELSADAIKALRPELVLLSSEPFPFRQKHVAEFQNICQEAEVKTVDGEMFSWYGSRLIKAIDYFNKLSL